jgi:hypothetical protein
MTYGDAQFEALSNGYLFIVRTTERGSFSPMRFWTRTARVDRTPIRR